MKPEINCTGCGWEGNIEDLHNGYCPECESDNHIEDYEDEPEPEDGPDSYSPILDDPE